MSDPKQDDSSLQQMDVKQLIINFRLNLEKARGEARSALRQIKDKSSEVNDLILAIDGISTNWDRRIDGIELQIIDLRAELTELSRPWYKKLWKK